MITAIRGKLAASTPLSATVDAGGLFYEVNIPLTTAEKLPRAGSEVFLHTVAVYREDSQTLYGFATVSDRDFFKVLIEKVSGIGPKIALNMMSRMSVQTLRSAISAGDVGLLSKCPGIGKKTAERLVLELKGTLEGATGISEASAKAAVGSNISDAISALVSLGLKLADADKAVRSAAQKLGEDAATEELVKISLSRQ